MSEQNLCETHAEVQTPGGYCPVCLYHQWKDAEQRTEQAEAERDNLRETRQIEIRATEQWREKAHEARQEAAKLRDALQKTRDSLKAAANGSLDRRAQMNDVYNADEALQSAPPASELHKSKRCIACGNVGCWGYRNHCTVCTKCGHPYVPASEPNGVDNFLSEMEADIDATSDEELRAEAAEYGATADDVRIWLDEAIDLTADRPEPSEALKEAQGALFRLKCRAERGEDRLLHGDLGASEEDAAIIRPFLSQPASASEPDKKRPSHGPFQRDDVVDANVAWACGWNDYRRAIAAQPSDSPAVPEYVRQRLWKIHSVLDRALGDTDCDWYETDDDMREEVPVQWAAKEIAHLAAAPTPTGGE